MLTRDFDFDLPESAIAQEPAARGASRLLVLDAEGAARHRQVGDLPELLEPGDLVVVNDTRVIPARLLGHRRLPDGSTGGRVEILLVERIAEREWQALTRPGKKTRPGSKILLDGGLEAEVLALLPGDGRHHVRFSTALEPHLETIGHVPLPPYIKRSDRLEDRERYQTVFAREPGAIAAPTAGLHLTTEILARLAARGIEVASVTLHVGIGTFKPVTAELVHEHVMESERWELPAATAEALQRTRARGGRIVAIGTTVVRTLESAARANGLTAGTGRTELFITPGFEFQAVDVLFTNFHLPCSTLLMLVSAFAGRERVLAAYREAIAGGYRFYSYGDAMVVEKRHQGL
ncbi:MAG: tRNA preQ1(34) S-adenosylmethionine ribosyltransferase-isomerase QueA [Thermoanaerobaculia bacterium]|nr:tRNA preQ1(34) S-adenosylmethionine ribosyltransferase-isomerase QueA [Thermoanaerobaculia bacterium]